MRTLLPVAAVASALLALPAAAGPISMPVARVVPMPVVMMAPRVVAPKAPAAQPHVGVPPSGVPVDAAAGVSRDLLLGTARRRKPD